MSMKTSNPSLARLWNARSPNLSSGKPIGLDTKMKDIDTWSGGLARYPTVPTLATGRIILSNI